MGPEAILLAPFCSTMGAPFPIPLPANLVGDRPSCDRGSRFIGVCLPRVFGRKQSIARFCQRSKHGCEGGRVPNEV